MSVQLAGALQSASGALFEAAPFKEIREQPEGGV